MNIPYDISYSGIHLFLKISKIYSSVQYITIEKCSLRQQLYYQGEFWVHIIDIHNYFGNINGLLIKNTKFESLKDKINFHLSNVILKYMIKKILFKRLEGENESFQLMNLEVERIVDKKD